MAWSENGNVRVVGQLGPFTPVDRPESWEKSVVACSHKANKELLFDDIIFTQNNWTQSSYVKVYAPVEQLSQFQGDGIEKKLLNGVSCFIYNKNLSTVENQPNIGTVSDDFSYGFVIVTIFLGLFMLTFSSIYNRNEQEVGTGVKKTNSSRRKGVRKKKPKKARGLNHQQQKQGSLSFETFWKETVAHKQTENALPNNNVLIEARSTFPSKKKEVNLSSDLLIRNHIRLKGEPDAKLSDGTIYRTENKSPTTKLETKRESSSKSVKLEIQCDKQSHGQNSSQEHFTSLKKEHLSDGEDDTSFCNSSHSLETEFVPHELDPWKDVVEVDPVESWADLDSTDETLHPVSLAIETNSVLQILSTDSSAYHDSEASGSCSEIGSVELFIEKMVCGGCATTVETTLKEINGIVSVRASLETSTVIISFDYYGQVCSFGRLNLTTITAALDGIGMNVFIDPISLRDDPGQTLRSFKENNKVETPLTLLDELRVGSVRRYRCACGCEDCICSPEPVHKGDEGKLCSLSDLCERLENSLASVGEQWPTAKEMETEFRYHGGSQELRARVDALPLPCSCSLKTHWSPTPET